MAGYAQVGFPRRDVINGGTRRIQGTIDRLGTPGRHLVLLHDKITGTPLRRTISGQDGSYSFDWMADSPYFVTAFDKDSEPVNAAISDQITLEPMP